ncbi:MAG: hypothetical protein WCT53_02610 [Candidatus Gracilibacteria bacterium]
MIKQFLKRIIFDRREEIPFMIFFSFLVTFAIARTVSYSIYFDIVPDFLFFVKTIYIKGNHIHHFNFGIILISLAGFFSLTDTVRKHVRSIALLYGVGLALIMDEFGLLVTLNQDVYWGRRSFDAIIITGLILLNIVYFKGFWMVMGRRFKKILKFFKGFRKAFEIKK